MLKGFIGPILKKDWASTSVDASFPGMTIQVINKHKKKLPLDNGSIRNIKINKRN